MRSKEKPSGEQLFYTADANKAVSKKKDGVAAALEHSLNSLIYNYLEPLDWFIQNPLRREDRDLICFYLSIFGQGCM